MLPLRPSGRPRRRPPSRSSPSPPRATGAICSVGLLVSWFLRRQRLYEVKWYHRLALLSLGLPFLANITGWVVAEMGRQPWSVYNVLLVRDSVSPSVGTAAVLITMIGFTVLYGTLAAIDVYLMVK